MKTKNSFSKSFFALYTLLFAVVAAVGFSVFARYNASFIWSPDGSGQHYTALIYWGKYLREIARNLLAGQLVLPQYDFSIAFGDDIEATLAYYVIGDPLNLLSALVPSKYTAYLYGALYIFRLYLSGVAFGCLAGYKKISARAASLAGLIYAFNSFALFFGVRHPFFVNPMIYLPLIILGAELLLDGKRPYLFVFMIFVAAASNFYFFYVLSVFTVLYIFVRLLTFYKKDFFKKLLPSLFKFGGAYVLGVTCAAVILFPIAKVFLSASRSGVEYGLNMFYPANYYASLAGSFAGTAPAGDTTTYLGLTALAVYGLIIVFSQKGRAVFEKLCFALCFALLLLPVFGKVMNGFSYVTNRWVFALALAAAYIFALALDSLKSVSFKRAAYSFGAVAAYDLLLLLLRFSRTPSALFSALMLTVFAAGVLVNSACVGYPEIKQAFKIKNPARLLRCGAAAAVTLCVAANCFYIYGRGESKYVTTFLPYETAQDCAYNNGFKKIKQIQSTDTAVERVELAGTTAYDYNTCLINETYGTVGYFSLLNSHINDFQYEMQLVHGNYSSIKPTDSDAFLGLIENVKYYTAGAYRHAPYGYDENELTAVSSNGGLEKGPALNVYENKNYVPFGFAYKNTLSEEEYAALSPVEKRLALTQAAVVSGAQASVSASDLDLTVKDYSDFEILLSDGVTEKDGCYYSEKQNETVTLKFARPLPANEQLYLTVENARYSFVPPLELAAVCGSAEEEQDGKLRAIARFNSANTREITYAGVNAEMNEKSRYFGLSTPYHDYYSGIEDYTLCFGYYAEPCTELTLTLTQPGCYCFGSLKIASVPLDTLSLRARQLSANTLQNLKIETDKFSGSITADEGEWLYFSVPFTENWHAFVDGGEVETYLANTAFTAIYVEEGEHSVEFVYQNSLLKYSACLSALGFACFAGVAVVWETLNKRKKAQ